jgi:hypothetical protein
VSEAEERVIGGDRAGGASIGVVAEELAGVVFSVDGSRWFGWAVTCERDGLDRDLLGLVGCCPLDVGGRWI